MYNNSIAMIKNWVFLFAKIITDAVFVLISFVAAYLIIFKSTALTIFHLTIYAKFLVFAIMLWLIIFNLAGLYKLQSDKSNRIDNVFTVSFGVFSAAFFAYVIATFIYKEAYYSKSIIILASLFNLFFTNLSRYLIWELYKRV